MEVIKIRNNKCKSFISHFYLKVSSMMITSYDDEDCLSRRFDETYDKVYDGNKSFSAAVNRYRKKSA